MDFGNSHFDCIFDSDNNELDGVSEYWVKGKDNTSFDFSGGITSEIPAIINDVWVDPANGVNEGNIIGDINNPFLTIDYAMSMIYPTEDNPITIHLTAGEFSPSINNEVVPIIMSSNINLIGQGEDVTIIDAEQTQRVITMYGCENNIISDLAITGGDALDVDEEGLGGGMFIEFSNPTLTHVIIAENIAKYGGGMSLYTSNPTLTHVAINGNTANRSGGGMHLEYSDPTLTHVTITDNTTAVNGDGGGMRLKYSDPTLTNVTILNNTAKNGGGMSLENSDPTLTYVNISGNTAGYDYLEGNGGGMFIEFSNPTLTHVTINGNSAGDGGGGIYIEDGEPILTHMTIANNTAHHGGGMYLSRSDPTITHVTIAYNTAYYGGGMVSDDVYSTFTHVTIWGNIANYGGGMFIKHSNPTLIHMTIANNMATSNGGGIILDIIEFDPSPTITNSIIWGNTTEIWGNNSEQIYFWDDVQPAPTITYSDIGGGFEGEGNIDDDPLFNDNFTLQDGSPCIDTGTADLDGDGYDDITDYYGQAPDMGAFEFEGSSLTGDLNGDGLLNILDVVILVNIVLGYGDPLPSGDLNGDGVLNVLDVVVLVNIILQG
jgi:predicted outer membrane repeat protein